MIRQEWFFGEQTPTLVTLKFHPHKKGTSLEVEQTNIPEESYEEISSGWNEVYMKDLLEFYIE